MLSYPEATCNMYISVTGELAKPRSSGGSTVTAFTPTNLLRPVSTSLTSTSRSTTLFMYTHSCGMFLVKKALICHACCSTMFMEWCWSLMSQIALLLILCLRGIEWSVVTIRLKKILLKHPSPSCSSETRYVCSTPTEVSNIHSQCQ